MRQPRLDARGNRRGVTAAWSSVTNCLHASKLRLKGRWMATLNIKNFPDRLYASLKVRADAQNRSVANEVTRILAEDRPLSLLDLQGLGKEHWAGVDAAQHVDEERASWD